MGVLLDEGELDVSSRESCNQLTFALAFSSRSTTCERKELGFDWLQIALKKTKKNKNKNNNVSRVSPLPTSLQQQLFFF